MLIYPRSLTSERKVMSNSKEAKRKQPSSKRKCDAHFHEGSQMPWPSIRAAFLPTGSVNTVRNHPSQSRATFQARDKSEVKVFAGFGLGLRV